MLIFSTHDTPRFRYAAKVLLEPLGLVCRFTTQESEFSAEKGPKMAYCMRQFEGVIQVPVLAVTLWRGQAMQHEIHKGMWNGIPTLYVGEGTVPFDVFGATFFMLSRYEEYWPFKGDAMERFSSTNSLTGQPEYLHRPIIDEWRCQLGELINQRWPQTKLLLPAYQFVSTVDLDSAFAFIGKGITRSVMGMAKDVLRRQWSNLGHRLTTLFGTRPDKYDTYDYMHAVLSRYRCQHLYFVQLSDLSEYDRNVRYTSKKLRQTIKELSRDFTIGIHPGVRSNFREGVLEIEKVRLEHIIGEYVNHSRQHYLMLSFPKTYQALIKNGITNDYTMGYADSIGFRAGTSRPFMWYDLINDEETSLHVHPIAMMDTTLRKYMGLQPDAAMALSRDMINRIKATNGVALVLWHNESLSETDGWEGWQRVWEDQLAFGNA